MECSLSRKAITNNSGLESKKHLGIKPEPLGAAAFRRPEDTAEDKGLTVWHVAEKDTDNNESLLREQPMVDGIGGAFLFSNDTKRLATWDRNCLGIVAAGEDNEFNLKG